VTEERKFAILFAATFLATRKLIDMDPNKPSMSKQFFVDHAIDDAVFILEQGSESVSAVRSRRMQGCQKFSWTIPSRYEPTLKSSCILAAECAQFCSTLVSAWEFVSWFVS
jgi:hypothetical protein